MSHTFTSFTSIVHSIIADISANVPPREPVLIYIGIGTFAGLMTFRNDEHGKSTIRVLESENYHQYPPFIRHLKQTVPNLHLYIILIDPMQENPPHMIRDREYTHTEFYEESPDKYNSFDNNTQIYVLRKNVTISKAYSDRFRADEFIDITPDLEMLNDFCMEQNVSLLYHDFSGRDVKSVAESFDRQLGVNVDTIVYGFGARADFGCYFDLNAPYSSYPYILEKSQIRYSLKFFNIYKYINTGKYYLLDSERQLYENQNMVDAQIKEFTNLIRDEIRNYSLSVLRMVYRLINGLSSDINEYFTFRIRSSHREQIRQLYENREYEKLFDALIDYYALDLDIYCKIKNFDLSGKEIIQFLISNPDPYKWASGLFDFGIN
jgi:hypothetical protein